MTESATACPRLQKFLVLKQTIILPYEVWFTKGQHHSLDKLWLGTTSSNKTGARPAVVHIT
jgi:hypothetical protein